MITAQCLLFAIEFAGLVGLDHDHWQAAAANHILAHNFTVAATGATAIRANRVGPLLRFDIVETLLCY